MIQRDSRWALFKKRLLKPVNIIRHRHSCQECGFLAFDGEREMYREQRLIIAGQGKAGWFAEERIVDCYKHLWLWEDDAAINIIVHEANRPQLRCVGFQRYSPGRSP